MKRKDRALLVTELLREEYGTDLRCYLNYDEEKPWQLLIATILSAQCTDERVNMVTKDLFVKYPELIDIASADISEMEQNIRSTGFYRNKARSIIGCADGLLSRFGGNVPSDIDELTSLPGVGRKTANVIRGEIYGIPSVVVDTHVKRVSYLLGLTKNTEPEKIEQDLMKVLPKDEWILYNFQIIAHGRSICIANRPRCEKCVLKGACAGAKSRRI